MSSTGTPVELGVDQVAERIHGRLQRYLEAQYHIRDADLIEERHLLLGEPGGISQRPFVEVTPSYAVSTGFDSLRIPDVVKHLLVELLGWSPGIGVFPPYQHQAEALEAFFKEGADGDDLIVATGTGSGKTETFLYTILGALALEAAQRQESFKMDGVRALLLYPMNALVSDQTARLRRLFGDRRLASLFQARWGRHPRFGMYTSRTPYPGLRNTSKDKRHIAPLLEYYDQLESSTNAEDQRLVAELRSRGRWPAKDIQGFLGRSAEERAVRKSGKKAGQEFTWHNWDKRLVTQSGDRELLTRQEIQAHPPHLLVTNYSMLEYMLLRPLERSIFSDTRAWLAADRSNQLLLILDEAHMYRGVGGAEVGLLIRRLQSRLGIGRNRLRCILTSASLGTGATAAKAVRTFAEGLTGRRPGRDFSLIRGTREPRSGAATGTAVQAQALAKVRATDLGNAGVEPQKAREAVGQVAESLGWPALPPEADGDPALRQYVGKRLTGFGPLETLISLCAGNATAFDELASKLFTSSSPEEAAMASDGLLALGCFGRRGEPGRQDQPVIPTRVHLLFRGLPPIFVCCNSTCSFRRHRPGHPALVGRLFTEPRTHCDCGARVYELLTHRDCGAAYLRVFGTGPSADFFWHERGGKLTEFGTPLHEIHILLEEPHPRKREEVDPILLDTRTGRVQRRVSEGETGFRLCYRPSQSERGDQEVTTFGTCPVCTRRTRTGNTLKIMDLATKGEQPFANLVREQFVCQVATRPTDDLHPNGGRKALLFSDGRQKAARLARDLPREVERDSFREAIVAAVAALRSLSRECTLDESLYAAFVSVCSKFHLHFFDGVDQRQLLEECARFRTDYSSDLALALDENWKPVPPTRYRQALLRQVSDPYYSLVAACAAVVEPRPSKSKLLERRMGATLQPDVLAQIAVAFVREMLGENAFDPALSVDSRQDEFMFFQPVRDDQGLKEFFKDIHSRTGLDHGIVDRLKESLFDVLTREGPEGADAGRLLVPDGLVIRLALEETWLQCSACGHVQLRPYLEGCVNCAEKSLEQRPPNHPYMLARKGFFREPLRAILRGERPIHITAEEHTAQLSQRDAGVVYATTEEFELRFQDVPLGHEKPPIDVLSCTTTMEVGIDIGSLTAAGLRTVPPQRENYQQRAGRAGRRGTSVSSVLTFAQGGAHDAHYFANPHAIISGPPREPKIKSDNRRLARRHIHSYLLQTFFHETFDRLSSDEQKALVESRPNIMSAFGSSADFFHGEDDFSLDHFDRWLGESVLVPRSPVIDEVAGWLPDELAAGASDPTAEKKSFVRDIAKSLLRRLRSLSSEAGSEQQQGADQDDGDAGSLLDLLFDHGILPSYAFPTDLCSFVIQEWGEHDRVNVKERPQLAKVQALSEYAPGRLLVVNKRTYRVGGIFVDGPPTSSPAGILFARSLPRYVGCDRCSFVRLEAGEGSGTEDGAPCPVCGSELRSRELLDPPAYCPEAGKAAREGDREQEITYASSVQLPELAEREDFRWLAGAGKNLEHAYGEDVLLIVANKGKDSDGFVVCESCGATWLSGQETGEAHRRPFLLPRHVAAREQAAPRCSGTLRRELFLGHQFRTDILLLRVRFNEPFDFSPDQPWLYDALATFAEALALGASLHLDIDPGELSAGFRLLPALGDEFGVAELYLFDTASGGAGYAADAGEELQAVLDRTEALLRECPGSCEKSCTKCLRHYGNRFLHSRLDRRLGLDLLRYSRIGEVPTIDDPGRQTKQLAPLARFLTLEGWQVTSPTIGGQKVPLLASNLAGTKRVAVGVHPTLLSRVGALDSHPLKGITEVQTILLPLYLIERDLPSAYQVAIGSRPLPTAPKAVPDPAPAEGTVDVPVRDLTKLINGSPPSSTRTVRLKTQVPAGGFAVKIPSDSLRKTGLLRGSWLVVRPFGDEEPPAAERVLVGRRRGQFKATADKWTVAILRQIKDSDGNRAQMSYGRTESEFRPERIDWEGIVVLGVVVAVVRQVEAD